MINFKLHITMIKAAYKTFGLRIAVGTSLKIGVDLAMHAFLAMDYVFFPGFNRVKVEKPVFILGHPRSGTTFFHRLLTQTDEFATFKFVDILLPSLTARAIVRPLFNPMRFVQWGLEDPTAVFPDGSHVTDETSVEEEELLFLWRNDTQMNIFLTPLAFSDEPWDEIVFNDAQPARRRKASTRFLRQCFKRQIYATGRTRIVAKMPYSTLRIKALMEEFPDGRFIYLVRSPFRTLPSHLSLHRTFFSNRWGLENIPEDRLMRYYQRRYQHNVDLYRYFHELWEGGELPQDRVKVILYDQFLSDLEAAFEELVQFAELEVSEALRQRIREQAEKQKSYRRKHSILSLETFGISREQVLHDLDFVFEEYGFDREEQD